MSGFRCTDGDCENVMTLCYTVLRIHVSSLFHMLFGFANWRSWFQLI